MTTVRTTAVEMPAGEYWVGDPCYAVPDERWMEWLEAADYMNEHSLLVADLDGHTVLGLGTAYGDGVFVGSDGFDYGVDAGLIGVVPVEVADYSDEKYPAGALMRRVEFTEPFECRYSNGTIILGNIRIDTDPEEDEEAW